MTPRDEFEDLPLADATGDGSESGVCLAISARARDEHTTDGIDVTQRRRLFAESWDQRIAEVSDSPKQVALLTWERLRAEIQTAPAMGGADVGVAAAWRLVDAQVRVVRDAVAASARDVIVAAFPSWYVPSTPDYPSRAEKEARREQNRAEFWAEQYATRGGTPEADAVVTWYRLMSDVAKVDRAELDADDLWRHARREVDRIRGEVAVLLYPNDEEEVA